MVIKVFCPLFSEGLCSYLVSRFEAGVEQGFDGLAVHVLANEYELLHTVAVGVVPAFMTEGVCALNCSNSSAGMVAYHCPAWLSDTCLPACSNT